MKRIAVLTTNGQFPLFIQSLYQNGVLTFADVERLPMERSKLHTAALQKLPKLVKRGDTVLVDEYSGNLARECGAKNITLGMKNASDVPIIVAAFGLYQEMERQHAIILPPNNSGAYKIPSSLVNEVHNQKGEISYQVDWDNMSAEKYLTLLSVYATSFNDVGSADYFKKMMEATEAKPRVHAPLQAIVKHHDALAAEQIGGSLAGQKIDENSWYL